MLKRLYVTLVAVLVVGWAACAQADISYNETFGSSAGTLATSTNGYGMSTFVGAVSPNPTWNSWGQFAGDTFVANGGSGGGATMTAPSGEQAAYVKAPGLTGGSSTYDFSQPLTISATLTPTGADAFGFFGLHVGACELVATVAMSDLNKYERVYNRDTGQAPHAGWDLGFQPSVGTAYVFSATLSQAGANYSLDYSIGPFSITGVPVTAAQLFDLSGSSYYGLGVYNGLNAGSLVVSNFSISQVPEPSTILLLSTGLIGLLAYAWRKRK